MNQTNANNSIPFEGEIEEESEGVKKKNKE